jgi:hypothetical protein
MALHHRLRKNDTHTGPTSDYKVLLYNLLKPPILAVGPISQYLLTFFDCSDNTRSIAMIFSSTDLTSPTELRSRLSLWVQNLLRW